jgi:TetR/AcrR family transcriptional regulator, transcriptional repressor for nem operon
LARPERRSNQERREQSTEQVLAAALQQFVTRGYQSTSIDDIARAAGLTKGAVYFYFKGKSALLLELLSQSSVLYKNIFREMQGSGEGAARQLEMFVEWAAHVGTQNSELLLLPILMSLEFNNRDAEVEWALDRLYDRYHDEMERVVVLGQETGEFNDSLSPREEAAVLVAFTDGMLLEWIRRSRRLDGKRLVQSAKALIAGGLRSSEH